MDFARDGASASGEVAEEIEANAFAAELLVPADKLRAEMGNQPLSLFGLQHPHPEIIRDIAKKFDVSAAAMQFRMQNLGLISF